MCGWRQVFIYLCYPAGFSWKLPGLAGNPLLAPDDTQLEHPCVDSPEKILPLSLRHTREKEA